MPSISLDDFKASIGSLARPNRFRVSIDYPNSEFFEDDWYLVKSCPIPSKSVGEMLIPWQGNYYKIAGDASFQNITITFWNNLPKSGQLCLRDKFEQWINKITNEVDNTKMSHEEYKGFVMIEQLNGAGASVKQYILNDAHPTEISEIELGMDNTDAISEFSVTFSYSYFDVSTIGA